MGSRKRKARDKRRVKSQPGATEQVLVSALAAKVAVAETQRLAAALLHQARSVAPSPSQRPE